MTYKDFFDESFIVDIKEIFDNKLHIKNVKFFSSPGTYKLGIKINDYNQNAITYFQNMLFVANFEIIDFISNNLKNFNNMKILDYACGTGILSVLLAKLNLNCYNYDDFSQIGKIKMDFIEKSNLKFDFNIKEVTDVFPKNEEFFVVTCSGYYINEDVIGLNPYYLILDSRYSSKFDMKKYDNYQLLEEKQFINIYRKR